MAAEPTDAEADDRTPFKRFEDLTRKLVAVPKAEIDELRKKHESRRRPQRPPRKRAT
jgi:hypothetical protein